jgi:hypothetical protein
MLPSDDFMTCIKNCLHFMCLIERLFEEAAELKSLHDLLSLASKRRRRW